MLSPRIASNTHKLGYAELGRYMRCLYVQYEGKNTGVAELFAAHLTMPNFTTGTEKSDAFHAQSRICLASTILGGGGTCTKRQWLKYQMGKMSRMNLLE